MLNLRVMFFDSKKEKIFFIEEQKSLNFKVYRDGVNQYNCIGQIKLFLN